MENNKKIDADTISANISLRDYFAAEATEVILRETQEIRVASFKDWIKHILFTRFKLTFLKVKYVKVDGLYEECAKLAYDYADALIAARDK
jgi:hypothetical protein